MYVRLLSVQHISVSGELRTFNPGDWVEVGRQTAQQWIAEGKAEIPAGRPNELIPAGSGIVVYGRPAAWTDTAISDLEHRAGDDYQVPYLYTLIWTPDLCPLRPELIPVGLSLLEKWDLAVPLYSYDVLAKDIKATATEKEITEKVILDMRVPVYEPGLMFVRKASPGEQVVKAFVEELKEFERPNVYLSFMRALWAIKPRINALPITWRGEVSNRRRR